MMQLIENYKCFSKYFNNNNKTNLYFVLGISKLKLPNSCLDLKFYCNDIQEENTTALSKYQNFKTKLISCVYRISQILVQANQQTF